ncbi:MAG TPA: hypothetical protein VFQ61_38750 [Polyangiaceae bacterium]|nr:hypothetical protein [Polyangiaceae bacterium]
MKASLGGLSFEVWSSVPRAVCRRGGLGWAMLLGLALLGSAGLACSSSEKTPQNGLQPEPPSAPVAEADFCAELAAARCVGIQECCPVAGSKYADSSSCVEAEKSRCAASPMALFASGSFTYDAEGGGALIARLKRAAQGCNEPDGLLNWASLAKPALGLGASCQIDLSLPAGDPCKDGFCSLTAGTTSGTCAALPIEGELCPSQICAAGLSCKNESGGARCRPLPGEDAKCSGSDSPCAAGLVCQLTQQSLDEFGTGEDAAWEFACRPPRKVGETAIHAQACESGVGMIRRNTTLAPVCATCSRHEDCMYDRDAPSDFFSADPAFGYCDRGACKEGQENVIPRSKPSGAVCFNANECRSLNCAGPDGMLKHCGEPNLEALFCKVSASP